jgi:hypothetical protein
MVSHLAPFQHAFVQRLAELDISYRGSPIIEGAGKRYFDDSLRGGSGIRSRFLLVLDRNADASITESAKRLAGSRADIMELREGSGRDIVLVRPDGYIAYSAEAHHGMAALKSVRAILERQTQPETAGAGAPNL